MPRLIPNPTIVQAAGHPPKRIEEFVGKVNSGHHAVSVARMTSPAGWQEPGQCPEFEEITVVLRGVLRVEFAGGVLEVGPGQAVTTAPGEWVRYGTPGPEGAEYVAICMPAFTPATAHRDTEGRYTFGHVATTSMNTARLLAVLRQRCPVCLEGPMYSGLITMYARCPRCGHEFERETGFFQGAMYVSWVSSVGLFATLALLATWGLAPRIGRVAALAVAVVVYLPTVPMLYRYSRVVWAHINIGTVQGR